MVWSPETFEMRMKKRYLQNFDERLDFKLKKNSNLLKGSREDHPNHERFDCTSDNITSTSTATSVTSEKSQPTNVC